jgi:hypothetical protein
MGEIKVSESHDIICLADIHAILEDVFDIIAIAGGSAELS